MKWHTCTSCLQANYKKLHEEAMESLRREKEDKEHIKSLFEERLQDVDSTYTDLLVAKQEEHLLHLQQSAIEVQYELSFYKKLK